MGASKKALVKREEAQIELRHGGAIWALNRYREDALSAFLDDLVMRRDLGFTKKECDQVKTALDFGANRMAAIPDGSFWGGSLLRAFETFQKEYANWNSHEGGDEKHALNRTAALRRLRRARQKLARRVRKSQHVLANDLDLRLIDAQYTALGKLVDSLPSVFGNLAKAVARFRKIIPPADDEDDGSDHKNGAPPTDDSDAGP